MMPLTNLHSTYLFTSLGHSMLRCKYFNLITCKYFNLFTVAPLMDQVCDLAQFMAKHVMHCCAILEPTGMYLEEM